MSKNINYRGKGPYLNIDSCSKIQLAYQWTFFVSFTKPMLIKNYFTSFH